MKLPLKQIAAVFLMGAASFGVLQLHTALAPSDMDRLSGTEGVLVEQEPTQIPIEDEQFTFKVGNVSLVPVAMFDAAGVVLGKKKYLPFGEMHFSDWDMSIGWGMMSDPRNLQHVNFWHGGRRLHFSYAHDAPIEKRQILPNSTNLHIIASSEEVRSQISKVGSGDLVRISGYLVNAVEGLEVHLSSLSRTDTGPKSAEILYVTDVQRDLY